MDHEKHNTGAYSRLVHYETYNTAEYWYRQGLIDQTDWDLYRFYWRNGCERFSEVAERFEVRP
jgi:hypothetical protein